MFSIEDLENTPRRLRDMADDELKEFSVGDNRVIFVSRHEGTVFFYSLDGVVGLPANTPEGDVARLIEQATTEAIAARKDSQERIAAENERRRQRIFDRARRQD